MKIAIDIDEVLAEQLDSLIEFYKQETNIFIPKDEFFTYDWWKVWNISLKEAIEIDYKFKNSDLFDNLEVVFGSTDAIRKLKNNNTLIIITARPNSFKDKTLKWLNKNFEDSFDKIYHSSDFHIENENNKTKADFCRKLGVDVIIEDNLEYSLDCVENGFKVILLDKPWNQGENYENISRCGNWNEILEKIKEIENEK